MALRGRGLPALIQSLRPPVLAPFSQNFSVQNFSANKTALGISAQGRFSNLLLRILLPDVTHTLPTLCAEEAHE